MIWHIVNMFRSLSNLDQRLVLRNAPSFTIRHFLIWVPVSELGELFKIAKFKNPIFREIKNPYNFCVF